MDKIIIAEKKIPENTNSKIQLQLSAFLFHTQIPLINWQVINALFFLSNEAFFLS